MTDYRKIYRNHHGLIPKDEFGHAFHIHHIDGDRNNNHIDNLIALSAQDHYDTHYAQGDWWACVRLLEKMKRSAVEVSEMARRAALSSGCVPPSQKGKRYWTNGVSNAMAFEKPGPEWRLGKTLYCDRNALSDKIKANKLVEWTEDKRQLARKKSLANGSRPPNQSGKKRWTNGIQNTSSFECPGPEWRPGLTRRH